MMFPRARIAVFTSFAIAIFCGLVTPASASILPVGTWAEFSFTDAGTAATGCAPTDPTGNFCPASSGTPSDFLGTPPWTFTSLLPAVLLVTDAFEAGDQFEIFDFGVSIGLTSAPSGSVDCGDDPIPCLATSGVSSGRFLLAAGAHEISITPALSLGGGAGFLLVSAVPEPPVWMLLSGSLGLIWRFRQKAGRKNSHQGN
jgi:hypothetical protein